MKPPFYLGVRSLVLFEAALRDVGRDELSMILGTVSSKQSACFNPRKQKLVEAEIARRKTADAWGTFAVFLSIIAGIAAF